jgi:hypothetical protein
MADGGELDAKGVFPVRTSVQGVFQRDGIEDGKGCDERDEEEQEPAGADLTVLPLSRSRAYIPTAMERRPNTIAAAALG